MNKITVFWFRRDLRLEDNFGLFKALKSNLPVLPIFIFDKNILENLPESDARVTFIYQELSKINEKLKGHGSGIYLLKGKPSTVFKKLLSEYEVVNVFTNKDYEPYGIQRDKEISRFLTEKGIVFQTFKDHVIFEENDIVKPDGSPYKVYTPYAKKWISELQQKPIETFSSELLIDNFIKKDEYFFPLLSDIGFIKSVIRTSSFNISSELIDNYEKTRDFPFLNGTSKLGLYLRFGTISIRRVVVEALKSDNKTFLKELIWREFFMQILWHFPHTVTQSFKSKYEAIIWRNNEQEFEKWCNGNTGYPFVDAGMRELNKTGFMHNRVRMLVGSFLCKHLLIDWRWGEAYFAKKLLDFELSSNVGNWQWIAGCGVDASPYFRIFNPITQVKKFDKNFQYIQKWVPEFQELTYKPMIEHKFARERCLRVYKKAMNG